MGLPKEWSAIKNKIMGVYEKAPVLLENVRVGVWRNSDKSSVRVISLDPLELVMCSKEDPIYKPLVLENVEALRKKLEEESYSFETAAVPTTPDSNVVDLSEARAAREGVTQPAEKIDPMVESRQLDADIIGAYEAFLKHSRGIGALLQSVKEDGRVKRYKKSATVLFDQGESLNKEYLEAQIIEKEGEEVLVAKRTHLQKMRALLTEVIAFALKVEGAYGEKKEVLASAVGQEENTDPATPTSADTEATVNDQNARALREALKTASRFQEPVENAAKGKGKGEQTKATKTTEPSKKDEPRAGDASSTDGSGPKDPENGEVLDTLLKQRREKVVALINAITTPQEFADFRQTLRKVEVKNDQGEDEVRWYFIDQDTLAKELCKEAKLSESRRLNEDEKKQVYVVQDFLSDKMRRKFFELKNDIRKDLTKQYRQELNDAHDVAALDALAMVWSQEPDTPVVWTAVINSLSKYERGVVTTEYKERLAEFQGELQEKRAILLTERTGDDGAWRQELDAFRKRFGVAVQVYKRDMIDGAWRKFLEATFPLGDSFTMERKIEIWEKELLPEIRVTILKDIVLRSGLDPGKAELVYDALLRELEEERIARIAEKNTKRVLKTSDRKPTT